MIRRKMLNQDEAMRTASRNIVEEGLDHIKSPSTSPYADDEALRIPAFRRLTFAGLRVGGFATHSQITVSSMDLPTAGTTDPLTEK